MLWCVVWCFTASVIAVQFLVWVSTWSICITYTAHAPNCSLISDQDVRKIKSAAINCLLTTVFRSREVWKLVNFQSLLVAHFIILSGTLVCVSSIFFYFLLLFFSFLFLLLFTHMIFIVCLFGLLTITHLCDRISSLSRHSESCFYWLCHSMFRFVYIN